MINHESRFKSQLKESFEFQYPDGYWLSIPDCPRSKVTRFIPEKPADVLVIVDGRPIFLELKCHRNKNAWPLAKVTQLESLIKAINKGIKSYVVLNVKYNGTNSLVVLNPFELMSEARKSISVSDLMTSVVYGRQKITIGSETKTVWDLAFL